LGQHAIGAFFVKEFHDLMLTKDQLLQKREDLSPFLIHLTRTGDVRLYKDIYGLPQDNRHPLEAKQSLESIIKNKTIKAVSPYGYFNFKVKQERANGTFRNPESRVERKWLMSVCFTETPVDHVYLQCQQIAGRQLHFQPYGLAFFEQSVRRRKGNPIFYAETTNQLIRSAWDQIPTLPNCSDFKGIMPLVEGFGPPWYQGRFSPSEIDFRWEREWRVAGHFKFDFGDVAFGLCETDAIPHFEKLVGGAFPFVDPTQTMKIVKEKLKKWPKLNGLK
jgi:hypothetical protein